MKVKTLLSGFDGNKSYEAGATLEGISEHTMMLLHNGAAEPLDEEAKAVVAKRDQMTTQQHREHRLFSDAIQMSVREVAAVKKK